MLPSPNVLYENPDWVVLNKPAGWAVHPTASYFRRTIAYWFATRSQFNAVHHRLMLRPLDTYFAVDPKARRPSALSFLTGRLLNHILLLPRSVGTHGWEINVPLGFDTNSEIPIKMGLALCRRRNIEARLNVSSLNAPSCNAKGGRQHQIRVHA